MFQGFLSDLLKKANRPYDEPKLQEYTQTIVSGQTHPSLPKGAGHGPPKPVGLWFAGVFCWLILQA